jgi:lipoprotein-anchoring transpeptidase ErfK/SrfK
MRGHTKRRTRRLPAFARPTVVGLAAVMALTAAPAAAAQVPARFPAAGDIIANTLVVRAAPRADARVVKRLRAVRRDGRLQIVHAIGHARDSSGRDWLRFRLAMRPNNTTGWGLADDVFVTPVRQRIVIDLSARSLRLYRNGRVVVSTRRVGVGRAGTPTPLGHFYVTAKYRARGAAYGAFALETSAYSPGLSDWPGGGIVGIHGTNQPNILPGAVSHGCVRVTNTVILRLKRLAPVGTAITVVR